MKVKQMIVAIGLVGLASSAMAIQSQVEVKVEGIKGGTPEIVLDLLPGKNSLQFIYEPGKELRLTSDKIGLNLKLGGNTGLNKFGYKITAKANESKIALSGGGGGDSSSVSFKFDIGSIHLSSNHQVLIDFDGSAVNSKVSEWSGAVLNASEQNFQTDIIASVDTMYKADGTVTLDASELADGNYAGTATIEFETTWRLIELAP
ncbi:MAG: hypothetical protein K2Q15_11030 [Burkholderiales bacterium]|nr:hypothetical protein [Burkholderiales bacterium]